MALEAAVMRVGAVFVGGVIGTLARLAVLETVPWSPPAFPWATLVVNLTGAFGLGVVGVLMVERLVSTPAMRTFLGIGVFGSYTTFSAIAVEGVVLVDGGRLGLALLYWVATLALGQMMGVCGMWIGRLDVGRRRERT